MNKMEEIICELGKSATDQEANCIIWTTLGLNHVNVHKFGNFGKLRIIDNEESLVNTLS